MNEHELDAIARKTAFYFKELIEADERDSKETNPLYIPPLKHYESHKNWDEFWERMQKVKEDTNSHLTDWFFDALKYIFIGIVFMALAQLGHVLHIIN